MSSNALRSGFFLTIALAMMGYIFLFLPGLRIADNTDPEVGKPKWTAGTALSEDQQLQLNIDVRRLLADKCYKCHNSTKHKAALILDTKEGVFEGGENGAIIVPGNAAQSEMIRRVKLSPRNEDAMPPEGNRLSKDEINMLTLWIDQGAYWADTTLKLFREAPLHLEKPELPPAKPGLEHPVDRLVDVYFSRNKIKWPEVIDDNFYIRKVSLDITGLIPAPEAVEAFVTDPDPDKYERLVDRLLQDDENYTLHWLSFWNDLLRNDYTGTGFITGGRKQITNWLYCAIYDNLPYDELVRELVDPREESKGFIEGIQWRGVVNASQRTELQAAQNISQSFLGLNLKCASCHNSFVNNVSLAQAYAFANVFADSTLEIYQCDKPTGVYTTTEFIYPELGPVTGANPGERLSSLADKMVSTQNGRLYRTLVNRIWDKLFGRGLVATVDDMDQLPWSQELLDWLAADFIDQGYDLKALLKTMLTSRTYRLQPVMFKAPEELQKANYVFKGPVPRRLTAEQFVDAVSKNIHPFYSGVQYSQNELPGNPLWIWHPEIEVDRAVLPKPGVRWFRKKFDLAKPELIEKAELLITVDSSFTVYLNEQKIAQGDDWREVVRTGIDPSRFSRTNCLAIIGKNDGLIANPAGILMSLQITYPDTEQFIISDRSWSSTDSMPTASWTQVAFTDTSWSTVRSFGTKGYWGYPVGFEFDQGGHEMARASLVAADPFMLTLGRPTRENVTTKRNDEATLLQAMLLSNDELLTDNIRRGARIWMEKDGDSEVKVAELFFRLLGRTPERRELQVLMDNLLPDEREEAWQDVIWSLLMLPEFNLI
jgi:hypothetical protein